MKINLKSVIQALLFVNFIFTFATIQSCGKKGDAGPAGQNGAIGPIGADGKPGTNGTPGTPGATGPAGTQGPAGTANVIYSDWFPANFPESGVAIGVTPTRKYMQMPLPVSIPYADIENRCLVIVYFKNFGDGSLYTLPALVRGAEFRAVPNQSWGILITAESQSANPLNESQISPARGNKFRYVVIPGAVLARTSLSRNQASKLSYKEACVKFNIPE